MCGVSVEEKFSYLCSILYKNKNKIKCCIEKKNISDCFVFL